MDMNETFRSERLTAQALEMLFEDTAVSIFDGDDEAQYPQYTTPTQANYKRLDVEAMAIELLKPEIAPDLVFASDWRFSETDNTTGDLTPTFTGSAPANWHAWLYVDGVEKASAAVDATGNYTLTSSALTTGGNFTVKVAANSSVVEANRSQPSPALPVTIVASETLGSAVPFQVRMSETLVISGENFANSLLEAHWGTSQERTLIKKGTGALAIPDPANQQVNISDRTVAMTYDNQAGTTTFNINTGTVNSAAATNWTVIATAGEVVFNSTAQNLAKLDIKSGGLATVAYTQPVIPPGQSAIPYKVLHLRELDFDGTDPNPAGKLDLKNNALIWDYTDVNPAQTKVRNWIIAGRGGVGLDKTWNGQGITSSTAGARALNSRSIAYADNATLPLGALTTFMGHAIDNTTVIARYTVTADTNLDGTVNADDNTVVGAQYAPGFGKPFWAKGDVDYNGFVDNDDATLLGTYYNPAFDIDEDSD
jgi:hypothetical protein